MFVLFISVHPHVCCILKKASFTLCSWQYSCHFCDDFLLFLPPQGVTTQYFFFFCCFAVSSLNASIPFWYGFWKFKDYNILKLHYCYWGFHFHSSIYYLHFHLFCEWLDIWKEEETSSFLHHFKTTSAICVSLSNFNSFIYFTNIDVMC